MAEASEPRPGRAGDTPSKATYCDPSSHAARRRATVAFNFSYFVFQTRPRAGGLLRARPQVATRRKACFIPRPLRGRRRPEGRMTETREHDDFDYVWDQDVLRPDPPPRRQPHPLRVPDGSRIDKRLHLRLATLDDPRAARGARPTRASRRPRPTGSGPTARPTRARRVLPRGARPRRSCLGRLRRGPCRDG